jgi:tRNA-specific 2-thiouridylase
MDKGNGKKVYVGMSGGVDSSVSAALLLQQGYEVVGAFMKNWSDTKDPATGTCAWRKEREDAQAVADMLGIPLVTFDFERDYRAEVVDYMIREYEAGRTPNPDVMCNRRIKFGMFLQRALAEGADYVATGHYARVDSVDGRFRLLAGSDPNKDQSYFLHTMTQEQLSHTLFPIGHIKKPEVRVLAQELGLPVAGKKDSQGICFIGHVNLGKFLEKEIAPRIGPIVTTEGRVVGVHRGIAPYTIGQRHGLGIGDATPFFVVEKDKVRNTLVVAAGENPKELYADELSASQMHWVAGEGSGPFRCLARIRYRQPLEDCDVSVGRDGSIEVKFDRPQRAIAPGQFVVLYDGDECLGGGVIK